MNYENLLNCLAPCGLDCNRCAEYKHGEIKRLATEMLTHLANYERMVKLKATVQPAFNSFREFTQILQHFSTVTCGGCRSSECCCPIDCNIKTCPKERSVDFCFQCNEYPCEQGFYSNSLRERWLKNNNRMQEIGPREFYDEQLKTSRY